MGGVLLQKKKTKKNIWMTNNTRKDSYQGTNNHGLHLITAHVGVKAIEGCPCFACVGNQPILFRQLETNGV